MSGAVWPLASHLASLSLSFRLWEMGVWDPAPSQGGCVEAGRWDPALGSQSQQPAVAEVLMGEVGALWH